MKVFISQPMRDKTNEEIKTERKAAVDRIQATYPDKTIEVIDSFFENAPHDAKPLWFLGKSIELLSTADLAYFIGDWKQYRGCISEHYVAEAYGVEIMEE